MRGTAKAIEVIKKYKVMSVSQMRTMCGYHRMEISPKVHTQSLIKQLIFSNIISVQALLLNNVLY